MSTAPPPQVIEAPAPADPPVPDKNSREGSGHSDHLTRMANCYQQHVSRVHRVTVTLKWCAIGASTLGAAALVLAFAYNLYWLGVGGALLMVLAAGLTVLAVERQGEERRYFDEWKRTQLACDLLHFKTTPDGCKADKLLANNEAQLRSYYNLNLEQCAKIFWVGILCLAAGIGVVAATLSYVMSTDNAHAQTVIGAVGGASAILINFVAVVFLKMHSEILTILKEFQSKLVDTQELYLSNVLASRIADESKRNDAFRELSCVMAAGGRLVAEVSYNGAKLPSTNGSSPKGK